jgi:hypothetical protein
MAQSNGFTVIAKHFTLQAAYLMGLMACERGIIKI